MNGIQKLLSGLKNVLRKAHEAFHAKLVADTLLDFAVHRRQNETQVEKHLCKNMRVHNAKSHGKTDAIWLAEV
jgi:hypothetical protein